MGDNLRSLDGMILNMLFNSLLGNVFNFGLISVYWVMFSDMFDLLVVSVRFLDGLIMNLADSLVFSHGLGDGNVFSFLLWNVLGVLSFIGNLMLSGDWLVISVGLLNWDVFNERG